MTEDSCLFLVQKAFNRARIYSSWHGSASKRGDFRASVDEEDLFWSVLLDDEAHIELGCHRLHEGHGSEESDVILDPKTEKVIERTW